MSMREISLKSIIKKYNLFFDNKHYKLYYVPIVISYSLRLMLTQ